MFTKAAELSARIAAEAAVTAALAVAYAHSLPAYTDSIFEQVNDRIAAALPPTPPTTSRPPSPSSSTTTRKQHDVDVLQLGCLVHS